MKRKSTISKLGATAAIAIASISTSFAQTSLGTDCGCPALAARTVVNLSTLADAEGDLNGNTILTCDKLYKLDRKIYVGAGITLTIKPGTVIKGLTSATPGQANALVISRDGNIDASGSETCPIIFTADADPLDGTYNICNKGQWGGVIILGKAFNNLKATDALTATEAGVKVPGVGYIEGTDATDPRDWYGAPAGANDDNDNSGTLKYVSIRHGGAVVGVDNEINGLTLGSVGRGTTLDHIEVISNDDDGIEFFGGTVDLKWATVLFSNDDSFDWDQGWKGRGQFWFGLKIDNGTFAGGDNGIEADGNDGLNAATPDAELSHPKLYNVTLIGSGATAPNKGFGIQAKERTRGEIYNSIFTNFKGGINFVSTGVPGKDAWDNYITANTLIVKNNTFNLTGATKDGAADGPTTTKFTADGNTVAVGIPDALFAVTCGTNVVTNQYNAVPASAGTVTGTLPPVDGFFTAAPYRGAFSPGFTIGKETWLSKWTVGTVLGTTKGLVSCPTDLNHDGITNSLDINLELGQYLKSCGK